MQELEFSALFALQKLHVGWLDGVMLTVSRLGNAGMVWLVLAGLQLCKKQTRRAGAAMLLALGMGFLAGNLVLKNLVARPRPCWLMPQVPLLLASPADYSFPSGHTLSSAVSAMILWRAKSRLRLPAALLAALVALSRLYLFVHFPTDVLAGALLALPISALAWRLSGRLCRS